MRILTISVTGLFGRFNHSIELDQKQRINVVHGPNGYGKSAILGLVHAMFSRKADILRATQFDQLRIGLEDNIVMELTRESGEVASLTGARNIRLFYTLYVPGHDRVVFEAKPDFFGLERWYDPRQTQRVLGGFEKRRPPGPLEPGQRWALILDITKEVFPEPAAFLIFTTTSVTHAGLISAHQLLEPTPRSLSQSGRVRVNDGPRTFAEVVASYAEEIRTAVRDAQLEYSRVALTLESSYPTRALEALASDGDAPSAEQLAEQLTNLENRRVQLATLGLLPVHAETSQPDLSSLDEMGRALLALHIQDADEKLRSFDALADKVIVLENIVDKRFPFKHLRIDAENGFVFESDDGVELAPTLLSAGERHQLLLLYQCLFKQTPGSLLLIDDPELSLHSSWHAEFLKDMEEVVAVANVDVLMATHAQALIDGCGERAIALSAPAADG